ncbi:MAG: manganese-dependent inorganic pyrophosphatase [Candidatus Omnitrophica bacterium]|nr:manganese-dependent inorganic pyrophosphatase [Candidatus Omnitrophota bacterium]
MADTPSYGSSRETLDKMGEALKGARRLCVVTHDNPDPDSVSSAFALAYLSKNLFKVRATVKYGGIVGRPENRAMIRVLGLRMSELTEKDFSAGTAFALVDMQPGTGNNSFPAKRKPAIIIDHHPQRKTTRADLMHIRTDYGATATMLTELLLASELDIPTPLATALSYGISSETQDLGREAGERDIAAYLALFPKSNKKMLASIEHPKLPVDHFVTLNKALHHTVVYKNAVATCLGEIDNPDSVAFIADFMLRLERMSWCMCLGRYRDKIIVSIRTTNQQGRAGRFLRSLLGKRGTAGGHGMIAGGQVPCSMEHESCTRLEEELVKDFMRKLGYKEDAAMTPLLLVSEPDGGPR